MSLIDFSEVTNKITRNGKVLADSWYVYVAVVLESAGIYEHTDDLWKYVIAEVPDQDSRVKIARRIREAYLKTSVLVGFPRGINALAALRTTINEQTPEVGKIVESDKSLRLPISAAEQKKRGLDFFSKIYDRHTDRVIQNLSLSSGGDLTEFALLSVYGELMAETSILDAKETGLLEFVACYATRAAPQAKGHMFGSRNLGNSKEEVQAVIELVRWTMAAISVPFDESAMSFTEKINTW